MEARILGDALAKVVRAWPRAAGRAKAPAARRGWSSSDRLADVLGRASARHGVSRSTICAAVVWAFANRPDLLGLEARRA
jgi:hypothetical protein